MDRVRNTHSGKEGHIVHDPQGKVPKTGRVSVLYEGDHFAYSEKRSDLELISQTKK